MGCFNEEKNLWKMKEKYSNINQFIKEGVFLAHRHAKNSQRHKISISSGFEVDLSARKRHELKKNIIFHMQGELTLFRSYLELS